MTHILVDKIKHCFPGTLHVLQRTFLDNKVDEHVNFGTEKKMCPGFWFS